MLQNFESFNVVNDGVGSKQSMSNAGWFHLGAAIVLVVATGAQRVLPVVSALWHTPMLRSESLQLSRGDANVVQLEIYAVSEHFSLHAGASNAGASNAGASNVSADLLQADVTYATDCEPPRVMYVERANRGYASLYQPLAKTDAWGHSPNIWQVKLREETPYHLIFNLSAGVADLDLSRLTLAKVHLTSQSDQLNVDMAHKRIGGMIFFLQYTGTGVAHIRLPTTMPVLIHIMNGLTQIDGQPMPVDSTWSNLAYSRMLSTKSLVNVIISDESGAVLIDA